MTYAANRLRERWQQTRRGPWGTRFPVALRATVAAGLAWQLCHGLLGRPHPYAAPVAALLITHATALRSCKAGLQYATGCALGALIAAPAVALGGPLWLGLIIVVFLSVLAAGDNRLGGHGVHVPITASFVLVLGRQHVADEAVPHLLDIAVGLAAGVTINAILFPPLRVRPAEIAMDRMRSLLAGLLDSVAAAVRQDLDLDDCLDPGCHEALTAAADEARRAVGEAHESKRWNLRPGARRSVWHLDRSILTRLEDVARHTEEITHALRGRHETSAPGPAARTPDHHFRLRYARLLHSTAVCVRGCTGGRPHPLLPAAQRACAQLTASAQPRDEGAHTSRNPADHGHPSDERLLAALLDRALDVLADPVTISAHPTTMNQDSHDRAFDRCG